MKPKIDLPVSTQNLWVAGICLGLALLCFILLIYPGMRRIPQMDQQIGDLEQKIGKQEILQPAYQQLIKAQGRVRENRNRLSQLSIRTKHPGKGNNLQMDVLQSIWQKTAADAGVDLKNIAPDIKSLIEEADKVGVYLTASGKLSKIRAFLLGLIAQTPNFERIQNLNIQMIEAAETLDLEMTIQLSQIGS